MFRHVVRRWLVVTDHKVKCDQEMVAVWVGRDLPSLSDTSASQGDIWCGELPSLYCQAPTGGVTGVEERVALVDAEIDDM